MKVPPGWDIPVEIRIQLGDRSGRQRALVADGHIVMVLHKVPTPRKNERTGVYFWRMPSGEWRCSERGQPKRLLEKLIEDYEATVVALGEAHEASVTATDKFSVLEHVGPVNRAVRNLSETIAKAHDEIADAEATRELQLLCDHSNDVARGSELLQIDARQALDFHMARQGEIQANHSRELERATHRLNSMAAIFLPLTAVASVFGMNLRSGLEESPPWMFWLVLLGSVVAGLLVSEALTAFRLRRRDL